MKILRNPFIDVYKWSVRQTIAISFSVKASKHVKLLSRSDIDHNRLAVKKYTDLNRECQSHLISIVRCHNPPFRYITLAHFRIYMIMSVCHDIGIDNIIDLTQWLECYLIYISCYM